MEHRRKKGKAIFITLLLAVLLAAGGWLAWNGLTVTQVQAAGVSPEVGQKLVEASGILPGDRLLALNKSRVKDRLVSVAYAQVTDITWTPGGTVTLHALPRAACAEVACGTGVLLIDSSGTVLEILPNSRVQTAPRVLGLNVSAFSLGEKVKPGEEEQLTAALEVLEQLERYLVTADVEKLDVTNILDIRMTTRDGVEVELGNGLDMENKIRWFCAILGDVRARGYEGGTIVLTGGDPAYRRAGAGQPITLPDPEAGPGPIGEPEGEPSPSPQGDPPAVGEP